MAALKDTITIVFYVIAATLAILSYLQAKKTIFQPIKVEIFKLQLDELREVLAYFRNKNDFQFAEQLDLDKIVRLNALRMEGEYIATLFPGEFDVDENLFGEFVILHALARDLHSVDSHYVSRHETEDEQDTKQEPWSKYHAGPIGFTQPFVDQIEILERFSSSPVLPQAVLNEIDAFKAIVDGYSDLIRQTVETSACQMQEFYATADKLEDFSPDWVVENFNEAREKLDDQIERIVGSVTAYLSKPSNILKGLPGGNQPVLKVPAYDSQAHSQRE